MTKDKIEQVFSWVFEDVEKEILSKAKSSYDVAFLKTFMKDHSFLTGGATSSLFHVLQADRDEDRYDIPAYLLNDYDIFFYDADMQEFVQFLDILTDILVQEIPASSVIATSRAITVFLPNNVKVQFITLLPQISIEERLRMFDYVHAMPYFTYADRELKIPEFLETRGISFESIYKSIVDKNMLLANPLIGEISDSLRELRRLPFNAKDNPMKSAAMILAPALSYIIRYPKFAGKGLNMNMSEYVDAVAAIARYADSAIYDYWWTSISYYKRTPETGEDPSSAVSELFGK
jgi:hypothetical protein